MPQKPNPRRSSKAKKRPNRTRRPRKPSAGTPLAPARRPRRPPDAALTAAPVHLPNEWSGILQGLSRDDLVSLVRRNARHVEARERLALRLANVTEPKTGQQLVPILEAYNDYVIESTLDTPAGQGWVEVPHWAAAVKRLCLGLGDLCYGAVDPLLQRTPSGNNPKKLAWNITLEMFVGACCELYATHYPGMTRNTIVRMVAAAVNAEHFFGRSCKADEVDRCWKLYRNPEGRKK
jgi:hypothetical protein